MSVRDGDEVNKILSIHNILMENRFTFLIGLVDIHILERKKKPTSCASSLQEFRMVLYISSGIITLSLHRVGLSLSLFAGFPSIDLQRKHKKI